jgi:pantoate--beta-alanine ligase
MRIVHSVGEMREAVAALPRPIALVPTMGALHSGHLALVEQARGECASVVATIFVNPLQFGPNEDFGRYPRAFAADRAALEAAGVAVLFAPEVEVLYPPGFATAVDPGPLGTVYEGAIRPGHFRGVATVCTKLFLLSGAERAYFGEKDAQQVAVLRRIVADLNVPIELRVVPTVRESDGLALSSRNVYLSDAQRAAAPHLYGALRTIATGITTGRRDRDALLAEARAQLVEPLREAYLDIVDAATFTPALTLEPPVLAIGSAWLGTTRLLDNIPILAAVERAA